MSRWADEYENHPFRQIWMDLKVALNQTEVDDQTIPTSVAELARLKRVVAYLDEIISSVDPDITPRSVWNNVQSQAEACLAQVRNYATNKNITHIVTANDNADNLLTYLKPYLVLPSNIIDALHRSVAAYIKDLDRHLTSFHAQAERIRVELSQNQTESASLIDATKSNSRKIENLAKELFLDDGETPALEKQITQLKADIDAKAVEIQNLHARLISGDTSTKAAIDKTEKELNEAANKIKAAADATSTRINELAGFHTKIFGVKDPKTGKLIDGLEAELDRRLAQLNQFEIEQDEKHDALFKKIEGLLPGATSAGLATEYKTLRKYFSRPVRLYTNVFYGSLVALFVAAMYMSLKKLTIFPEFSLTLVDIGDWEFALKSLLYKLPLFGPIIWLALFASTRRSQYERLQQEYSHKQALAASYESYKTQLQQLKDTDALQKELISKAIEALAFNASTTLDKKHGDKLPTHELLDKFTLDDAKKFMDKLRELIK